MEAKKDKKKKKKNQRDEIIEYIRRNKSITRADAWFDLGIAELPARICELKKEKYGGYRFDEKSEPFVSRLGNKTSYTRYFLIEEDAAVDTN